MSVLTTLLGHQSNVWCSSFTLDGSHLATCSSDETVRVWCLGSSQQVACLEGHSGVVRACQFSPDSTLLASCSWDKSVLLHRTTNFELVHHLTGHSYGVTHVCFSPSGTLLASCSWDNTIGLWDVETGRLLQFLKGHTSPVASCAFTVGGSGLASCSWDGTVKVWDFTFADPPVTLDGHPDAVYDVSCSPTEPNLLATCGRRGVLILWDLRNRAPWQMLQKGCKEINCVSFSPSGAQIATGNDLCEIHLWDMNLIKSSSVLNSKPLVLQGHAGGVFHCEYSPSGRHLASCSSDHTCRLWDLSHPTETAVAQLADSLAESLSLQH